MVFMVAVVAAIYYHNNAAFKASHKIRASNSNRLAVLTCLQVDWSFADVDQSISLTSAPLTFYFCFHICVHAYMYSGVHMSVHACGGQRKMLGIVLKAASIFAFLWCGVLH